MAATVPQAAQVSTVLRLNGGSGDHAYASDIHHIQADTHTPMNPRLPPELFYAIIDQLSDDPTTLATCGLVCRSWVPASRHHLFRDISITPGTISHVSQLLAPSLCTIISAVQQLNINRIQNFVELQGLVSKLTHVTQLRLCGDLNFKLPYHGSVSPLFALIPLLRNLESLQLACLVIETHDLLSLLRLSPRLRNLSWVSVPFVPPASPKMGHDSLLSPVDRDSIVPNLKTLEVLAGDDLLEWLMANWTNAVPQITTLHLWICSNVILGDSTASLLKDLGPSLEVLKLSGLPNDLPRLFSSFAYLTKLRLFSFDVYLWRGDPNIAIRFILQALRHLASPVLQGLTISLKPVRCLELDADTWADLGSLLETPRFLSTLRTLSFQFRRVQESYLCINPEAARVRDQWISERFRLYAARGLLRIESL